MSVQLKSYYDQLPVETLISENGILIGDDCYESIPCQHTVSIDGKISLLDSRQILELIKSKNLQVSEEILTHFMNSEDDCDDIGAHLFD